MCASSSEKTVAVLGMLQAAGTLVPAFAILAGEKDAARMGQLPWFDQLFHPGPDLVLPRRFLVPYLTTLTGDQFKVLLAVYCQWQLSDHPRSVRVRPQEIGQLCDLATPEVHWILQQLVQIGYLDAPLASDLDGYRVTIAPVSQLRE